MNTIPVRIIKIASCPSLSGKSQLTYHLGCDAESKIYFRVYANSSSGYFNSEWVAADKIGTLLNSTHTIICHVLQSIFVGKSANNGGFLLAVLYAEGLVTRSTQNERHYQLADATAFNAEIQALIATAVELDPSIKPKRPKKAA